MVAEVFVFRTSERNRLADGAQLLCDRLSLGSIVGRGSLTGIKLHFGEGANPGRIAPSTVRAVVERVIDAGGRPFLMETGTLYVGERSDALSHIITANSHGFTFEACGAPLIISDGLRGQSQVEVKVPGAEGLVGVASDVPVTDVIIGLAHVTGHLVTGMGAALKNIGMGLASRGGKLKQHSGNLPSVIKGKCVGCGRCVGFCPGRAIVLQGKTAVIDEKVCIGCGQCLSVCRYNAVAFDWHNTPAAVQKKVAEHVAGVLSGKKAIFMNFLTHITRNCDCMGEDEEPLCADIGIAASYDPVALDTATIDIVRDSAGEDLFAREWSAIDATVQLEHAERLGVGTRQYRITEVNT